tara:strand:- start:732 stop:1277 length:546 start_codon:yes stop_codon:yes gene_type:complete
MKNINKYLIFIFGSWKVLEQETETFNHIKDVLELIVAQDHITFITGEHMLVANIQSVSDIDEVHKVLGEFLRKDIPCYFVFPHNDDIKYRINPLLEQNLFGKSSEELNINLIKNFEDTLKKNLQETMEEMKKIKMLDLEKSGFPFPKEENLDMDTILEKIYAHGLHSLNKQEKEFLKQRKK